MLEDLRYKVEKYGAFTDEETVNFIVMVLLLGLAAGFNDGSAEFVAANWLYHFIIVLFFVFLASLFHVYSQRIVALHMGYKPTFHLNWYVIGLVLLFSFLSFGKIWWFLVPGVFMMDIMEFHRLGQIKQGFNMWDFGWASMWGCIGNIILAILLRIVMLAFPESQILYLGVQITVAMALVNLLPIPPLPGSRMFFASRTWYMFLVGTILGMAIFLLFTPSIFISLFFALLLGALLMAWAYWQL